MSITLHINDLPDGLDFGAEVAVDTETMGLSPVRDRLCLVQLSSGNGQAHLVQIAQGQKAAPNLKKLMEDPKVLKIFHFARFDIASLKNGLGIQTAPIYCTKIASRLVRTFTDRHGLKDLVRDLLDVELKKEQQSSDWGAKMLTQEQMIYAANDVLYLHKAKQKLDAMLAREDRVDLAKNCFNFLSTRADLDLEGWADIDVFAH